MVHTLHQGWEDGCSDQGWSPAPGSGWVPSAGLKALNLSVQIAQAMPAACVTRMCGY